MDRVRRGQGGEEQDGWLLSTGRFIPANHGILGIDDEAGGMLVEGFDGPVSDEDPNRHYDQDDPEELGPLSVQERVEIAEYMMERWRCWGYVQSIDLVARACMREHEGFGHGKHAGMCPDCLEQVRLLTVY